MNKGLYTPGQKKTFEYEQTVGLKIILLLFHDKIENIPYIIGFDTETKHPIQACICIKPERKNKKLTKEIRKWCW